MNTVRPHFAVHEGGLFPGWRRIKLWNPATGHEDELHLPPDRADEAVADMLGRGWVDETAVECEVAA